MILGISILSQIVDCQKIIVYDTHERRATEWEMLLIKMPLRMKEKYIQCNKIYYFDLVFYHIVVQLFLSFARCVAHVPIDLSSFFLLLFIVRAHIDRATSVQFNSQTYNKCKRYNNIVCALTCKRSEVH